MIMSFVFIDQKKEIEYQTFFPLNFGWYVGYKKCQETCHPWSSLERQKAEWMESHQLLPYPQIDCCCYWWFLLLPLMALMLQDVEAELWKKKYRSSISRKQNGPYMNSFPKQRFRRSTWSDFCIFPDNKNWKWADSGFCESEDEIESQISLITFSSNWKMPRFTYWRNWLKIFWIRL